MRCLMLALFTFYVAGGWAQAVLPYELAHSTLEMTPIDVRVQAQLKPLAISPALTCSDEVFVRRVFLAITGTLPPVASVHKFLQSQDPNKRAVLIDLLLESDDFTHYRTLKWGDLLRIKAEFPINLWPNGVQAYHQWLEHAIARNLPYDEFARTLLTATGSNFRVPPVNFYRAIEGTKPETIAAAVALTFMGARYESFTAQQQQDLAFVFSRVAYKKTTEWKEEIVYLDPAQQGAMTLSFPDGQTVHVKAGEDPREAFANWLIQKDNPWFSQAIVNRIWYWLMGRGIIHQPDDLRADNPNHNPELMAYLQDELIASGYDLKHIFRLILNSKTYQQSAISQSDHPRAEQLFAYYPLRRLDAEVLIDALDWIAGQGEHYQSPVPEPFTFVPETQRTIELSDGSISSPFLDKFGRPSRDRGLESERINEISTDQMMYLLNSSSVQQKLSSSPKLKAIYKKHQWRAEPIVEDLYFLLLSRAPLPNELAMAKDFLANQGKNKTKFDDLAWALINSKEFLYQH